MIATFLTTLCREALSGLRVPFFSRQFLRQIVASALRDGAPVEDPRTRLHNRHLDKNTQ